MSISRWVSYTFKFAYRKLTWRDISFLNIKAHKIRVLSSRAFFDKVLLNDILKTAVWNQFAFAKFYLRDTSQQFENLHILGPVVVAQKGFGGVCGGGGGGGGGAASKVNYTYVKLWI